MTGAKEGGALLPDHAQDLPLRARLRHWTGDVAGAIEDLTEHKRTHPDCDLVAIAAGVDLDVSKIAPPDTEQPRSEHNRRVRSDWERVSAPRQAHFGPPPPAPPPDTVHHPKFGAGRVLSREGEGPTAKLRIQFSDGARVVQQRFLEPADPVPGASASDDER